MGNTKFSAFADSLKNENISNKLHWSQFEKDAFQNAKRLILYPLQFITSSIV